MKTTPTEAPDSWRGLKCHALAKVMPPMSDAMQRKLADAMTADGYQSDKPIVLIERNNSTQVLDGRHRQQAAKKAKVVPTFVLFTGTDAEARKWIASANMTRRVVTQSMAAIAAAKATFTGRGDTRTRERERKEGKMTAVEARELFDVSEYELNTAKAIMRSGNAGVISDVERGNLKLAEAKRIIESERDQQEFGDLPKCQGHCVSTAKLQRRLDKNIEARRSAGAKAYATESEVVAEMSERINTLVWERDGANSARTNMADALAKAQARIKELEGSSSDF